MIRKAQIEMMGLVVIVILVTIGLFFSLALRKPSTATGIREIYSNEAFVNNFLITLLETQVVPGAGCGTAAKPLSVYDVAVDCVRHHKGSGLYSCGGVDSCAFFTQVTQGILDVTVDEWELFDYDLSLVYKFGEEELLARFGPGCSAYQEQTAPGMQHLSLYRVTSGTAYLTFRTCTLSKRGTGCEGFGGVCRMPPATGPSCLATEEEDLARHSCPQPGQVCCLPS